MSEALTPGSTRPATGADQHQEINPLQVLRRRRIDSVIMYGLLVVMAAWWLLPLFTAVVQSLQVGGLGNYAAVIATRINGVLLPQTLVNSLLVAAMHATFVCVTAALAGYAFSRIPFPGRSVTYYASIAVLAVPATAIIVPIYYVTGKLGLFNSLIGVALPEAALTLPFGILLMRNFGVTLPVSFFESAQLDGARHGRMFFSIYVPLGRPVLINLASLSIMWSLQDFIFPSLLLRDPERNTAAQAVQTIKSAFGPTPEQTAQYYSALVLLAIPAIVLIIFALRWMAAGLTAGGIKE
ncbi:MAG: carbohydrate ABC transporter permease [Nostocoides sp.]